MRTYYSLAGFTLIELLIVLAASLILLAASVGNLTKFFYTSSVDSETQSLVSMLRLAKSKAMSEAGDSRYKAVITASSFSVQSETGSVVEDHRMNSQVSITTSVPMTILFNKITGITPSCPSGCTITVAFKANPTFASKNILVSYQGLITIQ